MNRHSSQSGFTLLEIAIVLMVISILALLGVTAFLDRMQTAKVEGSVVQARSILQVCDMARKRVVSSVTSANRRVTHSYNALTNWSTTATLQAQLGGYQKLPAKNKFGKDILVRYDARTCYVAVDLDFRQDNILGLETQVVSGNTRIIVNSRPSATGSTDWVGQQKRVFHNEASR